MEEDLKVIGLDGVFELMVMRRDRGVEDKFVSLRVVSSLIAILYSTICNIPLFF
jgi:hypothetical protein